MHINQVKQRKVESQEKSQQADYDARFNEFAYLERKLYLILMTRIKHQAEEKYYAAQFDVATCKESSSAGGSSGGKGMVKPLRHTLNGRM